MKGLPRLKTNYKKKLYQEPIRWYYYHIFEYDYSCYDAYAYAYGCCYAYYCFG